MYIVEEIAPAAEPLSLAFVKNYLKVPPGVTADDGLINFLIQGAREEVEGYTSRSIVNKGYLQVFDSFPYYIDTVTSQKAFPPSYYSLPRYSTTLWNYSQMIKLLRAPLRSVTSIDYMDSATGEKLSLVPTAPLPWKASSNYEIGDEIQDANGNLQTVTAVNEQLANEDGTCSSGPAVPTWNLIVDGTTTDNALTWTNGDLAPPGDFIYDAVSCPPRIFPLAGQTWPPVLYVPNAVEIHFVAGYGNDGTAAPAALRQAMLLLISDAFFNRELSFAGSISKNPALERMLYRWKINILASTAG
jgi:hypothetical protein